MKKELEKAEVEVIRFEEDVVTTSVDQTGGLTGDPATGDNPLFDDGI